VRGDLPAADISKGLELLREAAERGGKAAALALHHLYQSGGAVDADPATADHWLEIAAENGDAGCQHALAVRYFHGKIAGHDTTAGFMWLERAAQAGNTESQIMLGDLLIADQTDQRSAALGWYRQAAMAGSPTAVDRLLDDFSSNADATKKHMLFSLWCDLALAGYIESCKQINSFFLGWDGSEFILE
jgi:TPR repeat protein